MSTAKKMMIALAAGCLMAPGAMAVNVGNDYTIFDQNSGGNAQHTGINDGRPSVFEDGEVEAPNAVWENGIWDMEGFFLNGTGTDIDLNMVGEFNMDDTSQVYPSGDIFIASSLPAYGSTAPAPPGVFNNGFHWVLDIDWDNKDFTIWDIDGVAGATQGSTEFSPGSDPWRHVAGTGTQIGGTYGFGYAENQTIDDNSLVDNATGIIGGVDYDGHNIATFDWDAIVELIDPAATQQFSSFWLHFTMRCGNDNLMGNADRSQAPPVPEPASMALLGMGILGVAMRRRFVA